MISYSRYLTDKEKAFCLHFVKTRKRDPARSWYNAFCLRPWDTRRSEWVRIPDDVDRSKFESEVDWIQYLQKQVKVQMPVAKNNAAKLLEDENIQGYIEELSELPTDQARAFLGEQVVVGSTESARKDAAKLLIADEEKARVKDAAERYVEILCAIGAEVHIRVEHEGETVLVEVPLKCFYPKYAEAVPPEDVIEKTIASFEALRGSQHG